MSFLSKGWRLRKARLLCRQRQEKVPVPDRRRMSAMSLTLAHSDFSTCEVSDALLKLGVPHGGHIPDIYPISPHALPGTEENIRVRLCGPAYTVRIVLASEHDAPKLLQGTHFVDLAPEGSVAFVSAPPGLSVGRFSLICSVPPPPRAPLPLPLDLKAVTCHACVDI
jgi:hypothetical protein